MYDDNFMRRVNVQEICGFIHTGSEGGELDGGTPNERLRRYSKALFEGIQDFRKNS